MRGETRREEEEEERIFDIKPWWMVVLAFNQMRDTLVDERFGKGNWTINQKVRV